MCDETDDWLLVVAVVIVFGVLCSVSKEMRRISSSFDNSAKLLIREQHIKPLGQLISSSHMLMPILTHRTAWIWHSHATTPLPISVRTLIFGNYNANTASLVSISLHQSFFGNFWKLSSLLTPYPRKPKKKRKKKDPRSVYNICFIEYLIC